MKFFIVILLFYNCYAQETVKILFVTDVTQTFIPEWTGRVLKNLEDSIKLKFDDQFLNIFGEDEEIEQKMCSILGTGISLIVDVSAPQMYNEVIMKKVQNYGLPYLKLDISITGLVNALDKYLSERNATDAAMIFAKDSDLEQAISFFIGESYLRIIVLDANDPDSLIRLAEMRPSPSYYAIFAKTTDMDKIFSLAREAKIMYRHDSWNFVFLDFNSNEFLTRKLPTGELNTSMSLLFPESTMSCAIQSKSNPCDIPSNFDLFQELLNAFMKITAKALTNSELPPKAIDCGATDVEYTNETKFAFTEAVKKEVMDAGEEFMFDDKSQLMKINFHVGIKVMTSPNTAKDLASWSTNGGLVLASGEEIIQTKKFYRIGTAKAIPWSFPIEDENGNVVLNADGTEQWTGYCVDLIDLLAQEMNFDYELVIPKNGSFGKRVGPDRWDGLVGDLKTGATDIAVAALTMTAEREEVIDFVAPYIEQTGILVVMRKPVRQTSMFKFMTVLKMEVWISILGALVATAVLLWILDTFSPYSARNNKKAYPYPCREFTLKESFWFALTSFTPQGGGEAPKAISGRTLVAAYWLFVVLMLATFTANLAAFLTVERMQTPVQSMEQLARQSRINYTVMEGSPTHEYFSNMKFAEETLYRLWKELTLNATSDQSQYRVWDYPIKEQYSHILQAIMETGMVPNASVGFQKVLDHDEADFAFIHDSSQIKYEVSRNCNLTTIGELFAEQPFALAVQQGSHLQEELSKVILDMQKNRIFEHLTNKYWNYSVRGVCADDTDSEGISLESLGGVFIATLFGLALAMITLAGEVIYYKRKERNEVKAMRAETLKSKEPPEPKLVTIGKTFKPVQDKMPRVSHISVFPRHHFQP